MRSYIDAAKIALAKKIFAIDRAEKRVVFLIALITAEIFFLLSHLSLNLLSYSQTLYFLPERFLTQKKLFVTYFCFALLFCLSTHLKQLWAHLLDSADRHEWQRFVIPQLLSYTLLTFIVFKFAEGQPTTLPGTEQLSQGPAFLLLTVSIAVTVFFSLLLIAPTEYWKRFVMTERISLMFALVFALTAHVAGDISIESWDFLRNPTLYGVHTLLMSTYSDVHINIEAAEIGTSRFAVKILATCSGYEGIGLISAFLAWYALVFKAELIMPNFLLLFPLGITIVWMFNCIRLYLLIVFGTSVSQEIAMQGFHSQSGSMFFLGVSVILVLAARKIPFFNNKINELKSNNVPNSKRFIDQENALLIPFLVLLAATLVTLLFSSGFVWLYPVRVVAVSAALFYLRKHLVLEKIDFSFFPLLTGALVFFVWIELVPVMPQLNERFEAELSSVSSLTAASWVATRIIGSFLLVPIAEELAFRGYLPGLFATRDADRLLKQEIQWAPLVVASVSFGALHNELIAGTIAGVLYYLVKCYRGKLIDAIVAHMTTNLMLCVYVLDSKNWSYW